SCIAAACLVELARRELEAQQREVELRLGPPEGARDLLDDLLLERRVRLLDVESGTQAVEIRTLVPAVLQLGDERLPGRLPHRPRHTTGSGASRASLVWYRSACARPAA